MAGGLATVPSASTQSMPWATQRAHGFSLEHLRLPLRQAAHDWPGSVELMMFGAECASPGGTNFFPILVNPCRLWIIGRRPGLATLYSMTREDEVEHVEKY